MRFFSSLQRKIFFSVFLWTMFVIPLLAQNPFLQQKDPDTPVKKDAQIDRNSPLDKSATGPSKPKSNNSTKISNDKKTGNDTKDTKFESSANTSGVSDVTDQKSIRPFTIWELIPYNKELKQALRGLNESIGEQVDAIKQGSIRAVFVLFFAAFLYGIFHALGPGHGKSVAIAFFLNRPANWRTGLGLGLLVAILHTLSALVLITTIYFLIRQALLLTMDRAQQITQQISYVLIVTIGLYLFYHSFKKTITGLWFHQKINKRSNVKSVEDSSLSASESVNKDSALVSERKKTSERTFWGIAMAIGVVPCPGVSLVLLLAYNVGLYAIGITSVVFMSIGMALTISLFALVAIYARNFAVRLSGIRDFQNHPNNSEFNTEIYEIHSSQQSNPSNHWKIRAQWVLEFLEAGAALMIVFLGLILLLAS